MVSVGAFEAKTNFSKLLERVEAGETILVTRHGTPVARLAPVEADVTSIEQRRALVAAWREERKGLSLGAMTSRDLINEGRR